MKLSTSPVDALFPGAVLVVGCEDDEEPGCVRLYLGVRSHWQYVVVGPEDADAARGIWNLGKHVFARLDGTEPIFRDEAALAARAQSRGTVEPIEVQT